MKKQNGTNGDSQERHPLKRSRGTGTRKRDPHFYELLDLASEGCEEAIHGLWTQFNYDFAKKGRCDE
jgi:hypothetical protein